MKSEWIKVVGRSVGGAMGAVGKGAFEGGAARLGRIGLHEKVSNQTILNRGYRRMGGIAAGTTGIGYMSMRHRRSSGREYNS